MKDHESKIKEIEKQISDNSLEIQKIQKIKRDLIIKENKLKEELRTLKNQIIITKKN